LVDLIKKTKSGAILYDKTLIDQISDEHFKANSWQNFEILTGSLNSKGRGNTYFIGNKPREFVLRHYNRGGMISRIIKDYYIFLGQSFTRSFSEWRILKKLSLLKMNVPRPVAARFCRHGFLYKADLITVCIPKIKSLSEYIAISDRDHIFWQSIGESIYNFHKAGVYHADLNAYNIQISEDGEVWILDFDKCKIKPPGSWMKDNLNRLHRSLKKVVVLNSNVNFNENNWKNLLIGYFEASKSS